MTAAIVAAALAVVVCVVALTSIGPRIGVGFVERTVKERTGLDLNIGGSGGRLLSSFTLSDVTLSVPDGATLLSVDSAKLSYDAKALVFDHELRGVIGIEGASVAFEVAGDGLLGWGKLAALSGGGGAADTLGGGFAFDIGVSAHDVAATYRDTAAGLFMSGRLDGDATFATGEFEATLEGSLSVETPTLAVPFDARFAGYLDGTGERIDVKGLSVASDAVMFDASGWMESRGEGSSPRLAFESDFRLDLEALSVLFPSISGGSTVSGLMDVSATLEGSGDSLLYRATLSSDVVSARGVDIHDLGASLSGDLTSVRVETLGARLLGGSLDASGNVGFAGGVVEGEVRALADGLDVAMLSGLATTAGAAKPSMAGRLTLSATISTSGMDVSNPTLSGLEGTAVGSITGGVVDARTLGDLSFDARLSHGQATAELRCCSTEVKASGEPSVEGMGDVIFSISCDDLSIPAAVLGAGGLEGSLDARGTLSLADGGPSVRLSASFPEGSYRGNVFAPAQADVSWSGDAGDAEFTVLSGVVSGVASFTRDGTYEATVDVDGLDLTSVVPDSMVEEWALSGTVSGHASVAGDTGSVRSVEGEIRELRLTARGHDVSLDAPFTFRAGEDTVEVSHVSLTSDLGQASVRGHLARGSEGRIAATFRALDIAALVDLSGAAGVPPLEGRLDGTASVEGDLARPNVVADLSVDGFSAAGIDFQSVTLSAESDTSDLVFDLEATSATAGLIRANGSVPLKTSRGAVPSFDGSREFGVSLICDKLEFDAGSYLMPTVRGDRIVFASGSVLLTGRADSLSSIHGRGSFDQLALTFDLIKFAVAGTLNFDLDGGAVALRPTTIAMTRRRVLNDEGGGHIVLSGDVSRDGALTATAEVRGVQIARLVRTFAPRAGEPVQGDLDLDVTASGTVRAPIVEMTWGVKRPVLSGLAFTGFDGGARFEGRALVLEGASLWAGSHSIDVSGAVDLASVGPDSGAPELDLRVQASDFDLGAIRLADPQLSRLGGILNADLRLTGSADLPSLQGTLSLRKGSFRGLGLEKPLEGIVVDVAADGRTIALNNASLSVGDGSVTALGFVSLDDAGRPNFLLKTKLNAARIVSENAFDARFTGSVQWAGSARQSQITGTVRVEDASVSYDVGLSDILQRRPVRVTVRQPGGMFDNTTLDVEINIKDKVAVENGLVKVDLNGGVHLGGTVYSPSISGGFYAEEGSFRFLENEFRLESLSVVFTDPRRRDPYLDLIGSANVSDRSGDEYAVTVRVQGFAQDAVPEFTSDPSLTEPDIISLLTFGDTAATLVGGGEAAGSSGDAFGSLARNAFISRAFGVAESALERLLRLDTVAFNEPVIVPGGGVAADVTLGKEFGGMLRVNYTTAVGRLDEQEIEVSLELTKYLAIESRADPEGDHAIDVRLRIPFQ